MSLLIEYTCQKVLLDVIWREARKKVGRLSGRFCLSPCAIELSKLGQSPGVMERKK